MPKIPASVLNGLRAVYTKATGKLKTGSTLAKGGIAAILLKERKTLEEQFDKVLDASRKRIESVGSTVASTISGDAEAKINAQLERYQQKVAQLRQQYIDAASDSTIADTADASGDAIVASAEGKVSDQQMERLRALQRDLSDQLRNAHQNAVAKLADELAGTQFEEQAQRKAADTMNKISIAAVEATAKEEQKQQKEEEAVELARQADELSDQAAELNQQADRAFGAIRTHKARIHYLQRQSTERLQSILQNIDDGDNITKIPRRDIVEVLTKRGVEVAEAN